MPWRRAITSLSAVVALMVGGVVGASAASAVPSFPDVPDGAPFHAEIGWLAGEGITTGYADGSFRPYDAINRDAMAAFMYRLAGEPAFSAPSRSPFADVTPSTKFYKEITWLASTGVSTGYADGTFRPRDPVKRDAMAAFMYRLAGEPAFAAPSRSPFADVTAGTKFYKEITWLAAEGVSTGWASDSTYRPWWNIARNAMAAFMYRFDEGVGVGVGQPAGPGPGPGPEPTPDPEPTPSPTPDPRPEPDPGVITECNDGIDNDGDGWADWENDLGCYGPGDTSESAQSRDAEAGWTTFDKPTSGDVYYVSSSTGSDSNDGLSPDTAFKTLDKAFERYEWGGTYNDYVLLKRGDTFAVDSLRWHGHGGISDDERLVVATYGESTDRATIEFDKTMTLLGALDYRSFVGLDFYFPKADPHSPTFDRQSTGAALTFHGNTDTLLLEDVRVRYGQLNLLSNGQDPVERLENIEVRRSTFAYAWNAKSWTSSPCVSGKTQGMYIDRINNLTIEDSFFHHNGWGQELPGYGCANMFNHNIYAVGVKDGKITGNTFLHASSISIKFSAFGADESWGDGEKAARPMHNVLVEDNFFSDSEIGISMGGNGEEDYRFTDNTVRGNVFSEMGSDNASGRGFQWGIEVLDNDGADIEDNYFVNSAFHSNAFGVKLAWGTNRDIVVDRNLFYDFPNDNVLITGEGDYSDVTVTDNTLVQTDASTQVGVRENCLVKVSERNAGAAVFSGNQYLSPVTDSFCADGDRHDLAWWKANYEPTASEFTGEFVDPSRSLTTYAEVLGHPSEAALEDAMLENSRLQWHPEYLGSEVSDYVKAGFARE